MAIRSIEIAPLGYARFGGAFYHVFILVEAFSSARKPKPTAAGFVFQSDFPGGRGRKQNVFWLKSPFYWPSRARPSS